MNNKPPKSKHPLKGILRVLDKRIDGFMSLGVPRSFHKHEQLLSPLLTLPTELLECIFDFCLPEEWPPQDRRRPASFSLSHVCRLWRKVALGCPYLWSFLPQIDLSAGRTMTKDSDLLENILLRSKNSDLWLHLEFADTLDVAAITKLARHAYRLRGLVIQSRFITETLSHLHVFFSALPRNSEPAFPRLQKLGLHFGEFEPFQHKLNHWFSEFNIPNLREVSISGNINPRNFGITHSGLRVLRAHTLAGTKHCQDMYDMLKRSNETLEQLEICFISSFRLPTFQTPISMKNLRDLRIKYMINSQSNTILREVDLPVLESLSLENYFCISLLSDIENLKGIRSLRRLRLRAKMGPGQLIQVLRSTPDLEELDISLPPCLDLVDLGDANLLNLSSRDGELVPRLKRITFHVDFPFTYRRAFTQERISALSAIGKLRFKRQESVPNCPKNLEKLSILITGGHQMVMYDAMCLLNQWKGGSHPVEECELVRTGTALRDSKLLIQDLECQNPRERESVADMSRWKAIQDIFSVIKKYSHPTTPDHMKEIYLSMLPVTLQEIVELAKYSAAGTKRYIVCDWAQSILRNWEGQILADTTLLWTMERGRGVEYTPADHPMRRSANALSLIFGLEAEHNSDIGFTHWH